MIAQALSCVCHSFHCMSLGLSKVLSRVDLLERHAANFILHQNHLAWGEAWSYASREAKISLLRHPTHAQLHAAALDIDLEDAHLHYLADGDDGQGIFDEAICHL